MEKKLEKIVSLTKRRGFVFPGSEIYGGLSGFYDYGPLGAELKFNIKQEWWKEIVQNRDDVVGLSSAIIMNPKVWEASGHLGEGFADLLIECKKCHKRYKADEDEIKVCENCGSKEFTEPRRFNILFKTFIGPVEDSASTAYLRGETTPGIIVNFKNIIDSTGIKIPFGIAQVGKSFRNEINPKDFIFRTREFEQMELEYFVKPQDADKYFNEWVDLRMDWYKKLGLKNIRKREQSKEERAHYSNATADIEYEFPFGWKEIEGIANRGDFDLKNHSKYSGEDLSYTGESGEKFVPYIIEPSAGPERLMLAFLCEAYNEEKDRVVLKLNPKLAPVKVAVFPLLANKPELVKKAKETLNLLKRDSVIGTGAIIDLSIEEKLEAKNGFYNLTVSGVRGSIFSKVAWDDRGNIGKRYYSQDEIGTPWCVTIDYQTLEDNTVTIRDRDTTEQERIKVENLKNHFQEKLK